MSKQIKKVEAVEKVVEELNTKKAEPVETVNTEVEVVEPKKVGLFTKVKNFISANKKTIVVAGVAGTAGYVVGRTAKIKEVYDQNGELIENPQEVVEEPQEESVEETE